MKPFSISVGDLDLSTLTDGITPTELQCDLFDDQLTGLKQETAEGLVDDGSALFGYVQYNQDSNTAVEFQFVEADSPKPPTEDLQQEKIHLLQRLKDLEERQQLHKKLEQIELLQQQQQKLKSKGINLHTQLLAQQLTAPLSPPQSPVVKELTPQHSAQQQFQLTSLQQQLMQQQFIQDSASTSQTQNCTSKLLVQQVASLTSPPLAQQNSPSGPIIITSAQPTTAIRIAPQKPTSAVQAPAGLQPVPVQQVL